MTLTAVVITRNEERVIERCLRSLAFCEERLVIDSGSTDRTVELARACGARVQVQADWQGFAVQRNRGLALAQGAWTLMVDADEWVPEPLQQQVLRAVQDPRHAAFRMPRRSSYCGQFMRHGGWWPDHVTRLIRTGAARYEGALHERALIDGTVGTLSEPLLHESFRDLEQVLAKVNTYSTWSAQSLRQDGRAPGLPTAIGHGVWTFVRTYVVKAGFLDGRRGFMLAVSNAEGAYYKYVKAMLLAEQARK
jgi:glycosyltransferase involved in cell wall biosynthesis